MDEDGKVSVNTVSTVAYISFKYRTILLLPPDNPWTELSDVHSLQHVTSGTGQLSDCQCQSDRVFYERCVGPRPGLCSQAVIAVPIVGLRLLRGEGPALLPALCSVLAE
ncbi:hypothetical protein NQZ68_007066 [Dissostichus eleginoides]|nr:hypothetical protein NQZ68_007066 [Dissostichus eleginoides]